MIDYQNGLQFLEILIKGVLLWWAIARGVSGDGWVRRCAGVGALLIVLSGVQWFH